MKRKIFFWAAVLVTITAVILFVLTRRPRELVLTGIVTTDQLIVSSEIQGRLKELRVNPGDVVTNQQLLAVIEPKEQEAEVAFYTHSEQQSAAQVDKAKADLRFREAQTSNQVRQAEANLEAAGAQVNQARAELEIARLNFERQKDLYQKGVETVQSYDQARTTFDAAQARVETFNKQELAARAALGLARADGQQVAAQRAVLAAGEHQLAAAIAQKQKAMVRLAYTEVRAPTDGIVDVRAALQGEVVNPGQAIITLINPDNLWVRADVEESYIDRIPLGDRLTVQLPGGSRLEGRVFYHGVDADYATQRDVSRTKRDIKTFEIRLRCDNRDRRLAVGMTAYVILPLEAH
jgi:HlyD family secretion protein